MSTFEVIVIAGTTWFGLGVLASIISTKYEDDGIAGLVRFIVQEPFWTTLFALLGPFLFFRTLYLYLEKK